jgi:hypothetical protein
MVFFGSSIPFYAKIEQSSVRQQIFVLKNWHCQIRWLTWSGMTWDEVLPTIRRKIIPSEYTPDILLVKCQILNNLLELSVFCLINRNEKKLRLFQKNDIISICVSKFHDRQDQTLFLNQGK